MKKRISRFLAAALAAALCLGAATPTAYAAGARDIQVVYDEETPDTSSEPDSSAATEESSVVETMPAAETTAEETTAVTETPAATEPSADPKTPADKKPARTAAVKGGVELVITAGIPVQADQRFAVSLTGPESRGTEIVLADSESNAAGQARIVFDGLTAGSYRLSVTADGYMGFSQEIQVDQYTCKVQLYTGMAEGFGSSAHPGLLIAGDFNGDGRINEADRDMLVDAMSQEQYTEAYDINRDGKVDMIDLQYFTKYFGETVATDSTLELQIPAGAIEPLLGSNTEIASGTLENTLQGEGGVVLATADGSAIAADNPLEVEFDFVGEGPMPSHRRR